ncbi:hypothetical protein PIIN_07347 [Serendipita indica DSM 11827]|uniref:Uncharacterized protein n=1 Tax=Serendipita indica (strain DSM 11827) TaxID=1109443 RepID=G4TQ00_SERID|nr:hypothetical protein PIIN_07347 [Serendipita indica DSM 11827]
MPNVRSQFREPKRGQAASMPFSGSLYGCYSEARRLEGESDRGICVIANYGHATWSLGS